MILGDLGGVLAGFGGSCMDLEGSWGVLGGSWRDREKSWGVLRDLRGSRKS